MNPDTAHDSHCDEKQHGRKRLDRPIAHQMEKKSRNPSIKDHVTDEDDDNDEYEALLLLKTSWAWRKKAKSIGNADYPRLNAVALPGEGHTEGVDAAVNHRGAEKAFDAGVNVAGEVS